jgi:hypothetical protein
MTKGDSFILFIRSILSILSKLFLPATDSPWSPCSPWLILLAHMRKA